MNVSWLLDFEEFATRMLWIRNKRGSLVHLMPNEIQRKYLSTRTLRNVVVKPRQTGLSTIILGMGLHRVMVNEGHRHVLIAHETKATQKLKDRMNEMYRLLAIRPKAKYDNRSELVLPDMGSSFYISTAGSTGGGRSDTIHSAHITEYAWWQGDAAAQLVALDQALPENGEMDVESTPNGLNHFYQYVQEAKGSKDVTLHFYPWWLQTEYAKPTEKIEWTVSELKLLPMAAAYGVVLSDEQVAWRRGKIDGVKQALGQAATVEKATQIFAQEFPEDIDECFLGSGTPRFDASVVNALKHKAVRPLRDERVVSSGLVLKVWAEPKPDGFYVIGADAAQGLSAGDNDAARVTDWDTGKVVASLHGKSEIFVYAQQLAKLGKRYNNAVIACERKESGIAVNDKLKELGYSRLFYHTNDQGVRAQEPGFDTNAKWRPVLLDEIEQWIMNSPEAFNDAEELDEVMRFVINKSGRAEADTGAHDDRVMALGIALVVRGMVKPPVMGRTRVREWSGRAMA